MKPHRRAGLFRYIAKPLRSFRLFRCDTFPVTSPPEPRTHPMTTSWEGAPRHSLDLDSSPGRPRNQGRG